MTKLVMLCDGLTFGPVTQAINRAYAEARGYQLVVYNHVPDPNIDIYWNRIRIMQQEIGSCDVLWWIDADAFFLRNDIDLPAVTKDIAMSIDWNGVCCGVMAVRNTAWVQRFLDAWLLVGPVLRERIVGFDNDQKREQTALKCLRYHFPAIYKHFEEISDSIIQNPTAQFNPEALILHVWNGWATTPRTHVTLDRFLADKVYLPTTLERRPD